MRKEFVKLTSAAADDESEFNLLLLVLLLLASESEHAYETVIQLKVPMFEVPVSW